LYNVPLDTHDSDDADHLEELVVSAYLSCFPLAVESMSASGHYWQLIVYVDTTTTPQHISIAAPLDLNELAAMVADATSCNILGIKYWDPETAAYLPLHSLAPIIKFHGRAQLWVQSDDAHLEPVDRIADEAEFRQLRRHVASLNSDHVQYHLVEASRVVFPRAEDLFLRRTQQLVDVSTVMLWYTANANSSSDAVENGFVLPRGGGGISFVSSLSDPNSTKAPSAPQKILLCEVALGRAATSRSAAADAVVTTKGPHSIYTVYHPHQALPRYILTVKGTTGTEGGSRQSSPQREGRPPRSVQVTPTDSPARANPQPAAWPQKHPTRSITPPIVHASNQADEFRCPAHRTEATTLWCSTCAHLVCPYCLSVGQHRGHDGRELDEIVSKVRASLSEAISATSERRDTAQRTAAMMQSSKRDLDECKKQAEQHVNSAVNELNSLLQAKRDELLGEIRSKGSQVDTHSAALQQHMNACDQKRKEFESLLTASQEASRDGKMRFLKASQQPLAEWHNKPLPHLPLISTPSSSDVNTHVNSRPCQAAIRQLHLQKQPPRHHQDHDDSEAPHRDAQLVISLQQQVANQRVQLDDLTKGYIWSIPQAEKMFHADQRKDIFSDVFYLNGAAWELRIASEAAPTPRDSSPELADNISVYLHSVNHHHRVDFRVSVFGPGGWHVREAKGWAAEYAGKGWGIRPFSSRKMILREFVHDGLIKICVAPMGGLY
jgi:hypothetical protein